MFGSSSTFFFVFSADIEHGRKKGIGRDMSAPCVAMSARYFSVEARMAPPPRCYYVRALGVGAVLSFTAACTAVVAMFGSGNGWAYENLSHENLRPVSLPANWQV